MNTKKSTGSCHLCVDNFVFFDASPIIPLASSNFDRETNESLGPLNSKDMVPGLVGAPVGGTDGGGAPG